jgi:hypothetical protein
MAPLASYAGSQGTGGPSRRPVSVTARRSSFRPIADRRENKSDANS